MFDEEAYFLVPLFRHTPCPLFCSSWTITGLKKFLHNACSSSHYPTKRFRHPACYTKWANHVEGIFRKCARLSFFAKKLRRLSTPAEYIRKFANACVIPIILYCSPAIFPGLLKHDFALHRRSIKLISNECGLSFNYLTNRVCERHIKVSSDFAERIPADSEHPLREEPF